MFFVSIMSYVVFLSKRISFSYFTFNVTICTVFPTFEKIRKNIYSPFSGNLITTSLMNSKHKQTINPIIIFLKVHETGCNETTTVEWVVDKNVYYVQPNTYQWRNAPYIYIYCHPHIYCRTHTHTHIYIYIVIHWQTVSLYPNSSMWLDIWDAWSWDRNTADFTPHDHRQT